MEGGGVVGAEVGDLVFGHGVDFAAATSVGRVELGGNDLGRGWW